MKYDFFVYWKTEVSAFSNADSGCLSETSDPTVYRDPNRPNIERRVCTIIVSQRYALYIRVWISVNRYLFIFCVYREL